MFIVTASAALLLMQGAKDQAPDAYWQLNSQYARECSRLATGGSGGTTEACNKALLSEPLNNLGRAQTLTNRGAIRLAAGDRAAALDDFNSAIALAPELAAAYLNRANVHLIGKNFEKAFADADKAVSLNGQNARAYFLRGGANEMLGRTTAAYRDYQKAAQLDPSWTAPKTELARFKVGK